MLRQVHEYMDKGHDVDYRILTHFPKEAVESPDTVVMQGGRQFRVFRDISRPNLVDFQGDLPDSRFDYFRALRSGRIISGVKKWNVDGQGNLATFNARGRLTDQLVCTRIYTLTGYKHDEETLTRMGCAYDPEGCCALYDYDGEMANPNATTDPTTRLLKGYFGLGPVLEAPHNPNAIVIPGIIFRLGDLLFGTVLRAAEYMARKAS
jgi:hypothetical protein